MSRFYDKGKATGCLKMGLASAAAGCVRVMEILCVAVVVLSAGNYFEIKETKLSSTKKVSC
jgi:hypothetical protein